MTSTTPHGRRKGLSATPHDASDAGSTLFSVRTKAGMDASLLRRDGVPLPEALRRVWEGERETFGDGIPREVVDVAVTLDFCGVNEAPTELEVLVRNYVTGHPKFNYPASGDTHPVVLATGDTMKAWLVKELGGEIAYWRALLATAMCRFTVPGDCRELRVFRYFFEAAGDLGLDESPGYQALAREYRRWLRGRQSAPKSDPDPDPDPDPGTRRSP